MTLSEKVAYFKGLVEGLNLERDSREGKLWLSLSELVSDISAEITDLKDTTDGYADTFDEINSELSYLEEIAANLNGPEEDTPESFGEDNCSGDCEACGRCSYAEEADYDAEMGELAAYSDYNGIDRSADFDFTSEFTPRKTADGFISYVNNNGPEQTAPVENSVEEELEEKPEEEDGADNMYSVTCPLCGKVFSCGKDAIDQGYILCPGCGKKLVFDFSED